MERRQADPEHVQQLERSADDQDMTITKLPEATRVFCEAKGRLYFAIKGMNNAGRADGDEVVTHDRKTGGAEHPGAAPGPAHASDCAVRLTQELHHGCNRPARWP